MTKPSTTSSTPSKGTVMRHLRWALLATAVLAYPAPALAGGGGGRPVVAPSSSHDLAETLETFLELPAPVNPLYGYGTDPCVKVGRDTLVAITYGEEVTCTAELGTVVRTGAMHFCSPWEGDPWYATNPRDGRKCARAASPEVGTHGQRRRCAARRPLPAAVHRAHPARAGQPPSGQRVRPAAATRGRLRFRLARQHPQPRHRPPHLRHARSRSTDARSPSRT